MSGFSGLQFLNALTPAQWALAGLAPVVITAFYFLKLKRKPLHVPSTWLWKQSMEDLRVNSFWQRLRKNILLLLQLLAVAAALLALSHPAVNAQEEGRHWIFALDNSASMSVADGAPSRLDEAKTKAVQFIDANFGPSDYAMVLSFNDAARVVCSYTNNSQAVKRAIQSVPATARRTDLTEALGVATGLPNPQTGGEIGKEIFAEAVAATMLILSDGGFPKLPNASLGRLEVRYLAVGREANNVGIVRMAARRVQTRGEQIEVFGAVHNFGAVQVSTVAELDVNGRPLDLQNLTIGPDEDAPFLFRVEAGGSLVLHVKLNVADAFTLDDEAWAVVEPPRKVRVLVVGDNDLILKTVFRTVELVERADVVFAPKSLAEKDLSDDPSTQNYDLAVFDRCSPKGMPPCNALFFGAAPPASPEAPKTTVEGPAILNWNATHPALRYLALDDVHIAKAFILPEQRGVEKLIETDKGAVLLGAPRGVYTDLIQTFPLIDDAGAWQSDWPLKLSFPLYILNVVNSFGGVEAELRRALGPGDAISFRGNEKFAEATVSTPGGARRTLKRSKLGAFELLDTDELGVYQAKVGEDVQRFAVNLFDVAESRIRPAAEIVVGAESQSNAAVNFAVRRELWKWLTLAALVMLLVEWYVYNRRVYV